MAAKERTTIWYLLAGLTALSVPGALYNPHTGGVAPIGIGGAVISVICVAALIRRKRWGIWLTGFRAAAGLVLGMSDCDSFVRWAGGWEQVKHSEKVWIISVFVYLAVLALACLVAFILTEESKSYEPFDPSIGDD